MSIDEMQKRGVIRTTLNWVEAENRGNNSPTSSNKEFVVFTVQLYIPETLKISI